MAEYSKFIDDFHSFIRDVMGDKIFNAEKAVLGYARGLASKDLPSGGGSYLPSIRFRTMRREKEIVGELYSDHQWAAAVEYGTPMHEIESDRLMRASPLLAERGGKERPYGTRYDYDTVVRGKRFLHPGARPFRIFTRTFNWALGRDDSWINRAWDVNIV